MKKILAISIASLGLAVMPVAGVFADNPAALTDTINLTVSENCTLTRQVSATGDYVTTATTYSQSMNPGTTKNDFGTSVLKVICNNKNGFSVTADFSNFSGTGSAISYSSAAPVTTAGAATWTAVKGTSTSTTYITNNSAVLSGNGVTDASGTTQQVTYKVATATNQAKGAYSATATNTLTQNS